jgi:hypothetical protein
VWVQTNLGPIETTLPRPAPAFYVGDHPPTGEDGAEGAVYLNAKTGTFYGPKTADGIWPGIGRLIPGPGPHEP